MRMTEKNIKKPKGDAKYNKIKIKSRKGMFGMF